MLRSYGGDYACLRVNDAADFVDVACLLGTHLHDEHFMIGFKLFSNGAYHTHRGIEAAGSHQRFVFLGENAVQIVLCCGFTVAARDAYNFQVRHIGQTGFRIVDVSAGYMFFNRREQSVCHNDKNQRAAVASEEGSGCYKKTMQQPAVEQNHGNCNNQSGHKERRGHYAPCARCHDKRFLVLFAAEMSVAENEENTAQNHCRRVRETWNKSGEEYHHATQTPGVGAVAAFRNPAAEAVGAVAVLLEHHQYAAQLYSQVGEREQSDNNV